MQQLGFLWYHEVMHWLRQREARAEDLHAQPMVWNLACDMEINDYLPEGLAYPDFGGAFKGVFPWDYGFEEGHTAEWYYRRLLEQAQSQEQEPSGEGDTGENEPSAGATNGVWDEGSGVHGQPRPWELPAESDETPALSEFDRQAVEETVPRNILEHQKNRGTLPARMVRWERRC